MFLHVYYILLNCAWMLVPRAILGAVGAFWALVLEPFSTHLAPEILKKAIGKPIVLAFCYSLLDFASMLVPRAILGAVVAFWALFLEPLSTQLA